MEITVMIPSDNVHSDHSQSHHYGTHGEGKSVVADQKGDQSHDEGNVQGGTQILWPVAPQPTVIRRIDQTTLESAITHIWVVAYPIPDTNFNHWVAFLQISDDKSVEVNMSPGGDGSTGVIMFQFQDYVLSKNAAFQTEFATINGPTIQQILDLVTSPDSRNVKLDRYKFTSEGTGCAFWIHQFFLRMEEISYIPDGTAAGVWEVMQSYYVAGQRVGPNIGVDSRRGTFY